MAGFKVRVLLLATSLFSIFTLSGYFFLLSSRGKQNNGAALLKRGPFRFSQKNFDNRSRRRFSKSDIDSVLLDLSNKKIVNCSQIERLCRDEQLITYKHTYDIIRQDVVDFSRVVLVVTLNKPHYEAIPKLHRLYRKIFSKIIYCMPSVYKLPERLKKLVNVSIVEYAKEPSEPTGALFYMCLPIVLELLSGAESDNLDGILTISDDLIPNLWHFRRNRNKVNCLRDRLWLMNQQMDIFDVDSLQFCRGFSPNNKLDCDIVGKHRWQVNIDNQPKLKAFLEEANETFPNFIKYLYENSRGHRRIFNNYADLFYVSVEFFEKAYEIFRLFGKHDVYMEFAVGTAFRGMVADQDHQIDFIDRSGQMGPEERHLLPSDMYDARRAIYHPFKLAHLEDRAFTEQCVYCAISGMMDAYSQLMSLSIASI